MLSEELVHCICILKFTCVELFVISLYYLLMFAGCVVISPVSIKICLICILALVFGSFDRGLSMLLISRESAFTFFPYSSSFTFR